MQKTEYQIHLHLLPNNTYGIASFDSMTEAMLYLQTLIVDLLAHPAIVDADWLDDDHVHLLGRNGDIIGHVTLVMETITYH